MHKLTSFFCVFLSLGILLPLAAHPGNVDLLASALGNELTIQEMDETEGALHIRGIRVRNRIRRSRRRSFRSSNRRAAHCDIIARNRAESLGRDTDAGSGGRLDFNHVTVSQIYQHYQGSATSTPRPGTAGYIFTAYGAGKSHLQVYDARNQGANSYRRYSNNSRPGSESLYSAPNSFRPEDVTAQAFVALPGRSHWTVWSR